MNILLIEPDVLLAKAYCAAMQRKGWRVQHVIDAQSAINAADTQRPDVVVLELQLVGHSGIEFLQEFRSYTEWLAIPVLVLTLIKPEAIQSNSVLCQQLSIARVLYKPVTSLDTLLLAVDAIQQGQA